MFVSLLCRGSFSGEKTKKEKSGGIERHGGRRQGAKGGRPPLTLVVTRMDTQKTEIRWETGIQALEIAWVRPGLNVAFYMRRIQY